MDNEIPELLKNLCQKNVNSYSVKIIDKTENIKSSFGSYNISKEFINELINTTNMQKISIDEHLYRIIEFKLDDEKKNITLKIEMEIVPF